MALPLLAAIPAILGGITSGISAALSMVVSAIGKKVLIYGFFLVAYSLLIVDFVSSLNSRLTGIANQLPNDSFLLAGLSLVPNNSVTCATIVVGAKVAQSVFYFSLGLLKAKLKA